MAKVRTNYKICFKKTYITCITNKHYFFLNNEPFAFKIRAERLIAFAIISRYEKKTRFLNRRGCDYTVTWHARVMYDDRMTFKCGERKHKETSALLALAVLWWHTWIGLAVQLEVEHNRSSLQRKHHVGTLLCCQVHSLPRVVFMSTGLS